MNGAGRVFLFDVDNTLLDNDRFAADLGARIESGFGAAERERYWAIFNYLRDELGRADYLASLQIFRSGMDGQADMLEMSQYLLEYPFARLLYPGALQAVAHLGEFGTTAVLSDGDIVYQPRKIHRSGVWDAVGGRVLIYLHKERSVEPMQRRFPAPHYVMVDDKPNLLAAMKLALGRRLTTVFVRQGHYAASARTRTIEPPPDRVIDHIGDLMGFNSSDFEEAS
jgi:phosphoglycolate phosphatase-like HAD superfamily hydrolase